jgi:basic membrane protein A and related proteins
MGTYFGRMYQASYLTGLVAGTMTQKKRIGYVAPIPIPEVIRITNAFVLGVRAGNPEVNVHVVWTNAWYDPATESEAANSLLDIGVDVIATQSDSPAPVQTAERRGAYGVGFNADASKFAPTKHLTSAVWNWGPYYVEAVKQVRAGSWKSTDQWWPIGTGIVGLSPLGPTVADTLKNLVEERKQDLIAGRFDVFWGPIKDQPGKLRIAAGEKPVDEILLGMDWFVEGVVGTVPKWSTGVCCRESGRPLGSGLPLVLRPLQPAGSLLRFLLILLTGAPEEQACGGFSDRRRYAQHRGDMEDPVSHCGRARTLRKGHTGGSIVQGLDFSL